MRRRPETITFDGRTWITLLGASIVVRRSKSAIRKWTDAKYLEVRWHRDPQYVDGRAVIECEAARRTPHAATKSSDRQAGSPHVTVRP